VSEVVNRGIKVLAKASEEMSDNLSGWNNIAQNPLAKDMFATSSVQFKKSADTQDHGSI